MPINTDLNLQTTEPRPNYLTLGNWKRGVITLIDKSRLPKDALEQADNLFLVEDGQPQPRPGVDWFGTAPSLAGGPSFSLSPSASLSSSGSQSMSPSASRSPSSSTSMSPSASLSPSASTSISPSASVSISPSASRSPSASVSASPSAGDLSEIDGFDYFDFDGVIHLVAASGGVIYRSTDDAATWTPCTGFTYTPGTEVNMNQYNAFLYITDGVDNIIRYDGTTTLQSYTSLSTPTGVSAAKTGLGATTYTYYYKVAAVNAIGFSAASSSSSIAVSLTRDNWDTTSNFVTVTWNTVTNATRYDIYLSENNLDYYYLGSTLSTELTFKDDGTAVVIPSTTAPTDNTTQGPLVEELVNVGSRMYGVRDSNNRYRIWFTSGNNPKGSFSNAYDGGYLDWQEGGKYIPQKVEDYRDGKGTPFATVWCNSADGQGCILQMSLDVLTIGDISITVPSAYKLPGSRGTPAPKSVVNVLNDFHYYNSQAFYNLGSRAQFLNLLSTDESSANIRPSIRQITTEGESQIASVYFDARVYFSVPYGASQNNNTAIYDTERKAWLPKAFTLGFKKFLRYTTTTGEKVLLAVKPGDTVLSQISKNFGGDYGEPFQTVLKTGLYPITKSRFEFQYVEEGEIELSNPLGDVLIDLNGIDRATGYHNIVSKSLSVGAGTTTSTGHDTFLHDSTLHDDTSVVAEVFSESSVKRYFKVNKELNAVQWGISTSSLNATYILRALQTWGTETLAGKPRQWRI